MTEERVSSLSTGMEADEEEEEAVRKAPPRWCSSNGGGGEVLLRVGHVVEERAAGLGRPEGAPDTLAILVRPMVKRRSQVRDSRRRRRRGRLGVARR